MGNLEERIAKINSNNTKYNAATYVHSDDIGIGSHFRLISETLKAKPRPVLGLVVGTGLVLTTVKELPVDIYVVCDINKFILRWVDYTLQAVLRNERRENYVREVYSSALAHMTRQHTYGTGLECDLINEMQQTGQTHFLSSQSMYDQTRKSLPQRKIITVCCDLTDASFTQQLANILKENGLSISYVKISDVYEFAPEILESLPILPFSEDAKILWSSSAESVQQNLDHPVARVSTGLRVYLDQAEKSRDLFHLRWTQKFQG